MKQTSLQHQPYDTKLYYKYIEGVLNGDIVSNEYIYLACKRFNDWQSRPDMYFDEEHVDYLIKWLYKLKHTRAPFTGQNFRLLDWQQFCIANIFGWKWKETGLRVITKVYLQIARKAGKTAFAAAIALICGLVEKEVGAEVEIVANSREQAQIALGACKDFVDSIDHQHKILETYKTTIKIPKLKSMIQVLSSASMKLDGYNSSCFIVDEFHAAKTWDIYNAMVSSQGMREQPLGIVITTAGFLLDGYPCYEMRKTCIDVLEGKLIDDNQFSAIYELDEYDDWKNEDVWKKCQPSLDQTVTRKYMREQVTTALNQPSLTNAILTKNFNKFCHSSMAWLPYDVLSSSVQHVNLLDYIGEECYIGVDLSENQDLTALAMFIPPNPDREIYPDKYIFKVIAYLPESVMNRSVNRVLYETWSRNKQLILTPGNVTDYDDVLDDIKKINASFGLEKIAYDAWNAKTFANNATKAGLDLQPFSQTIGNFSVVTKAFEREILQGNVILDDNPIILWCFENVVLKTDHNGNCKPHKGLDRTKKIDAVIAMLQAYGTWLIYNDTEE